MSKVNYGALEDQAFDEKNTYYLKDTPLTAAEKRKKFMLVAVPILAAILIMGGAVLFLLRDFDSLYPGRHGGTPTPKIRTSEPHSSQDTQTKTAPSPPAGEQKGESDVASSCVAHEKCSKLVGECCPTLDGVFLGCCN